MREIRLTGRHAVGAHSVALVDDDRFDELNKHKWKAKPNGSGANVYAIRVVRVDGKWHDIRMHREVLGYDGQLDVDHIDHNSLNNQQANLRIATRSLNVRNGKPVAVDVECRHCHSTIARTTRRNSANRIVYCSRACDVAANRSIYQPVGQHSLRCSHCHKTFNASRSDQKYCGVSCRAAAKWKKWKSTGHPQVAKNVARARAWRAKRRGEHVHNAGPSVSSHLV